MDTQEFLQNIQDKSYFVQQVKDQLNDTSFAAIQDMKKEMANDFIRQQQGDND